MFCVKSKRGYSTYSDFGPDGLYDSTAVAFSPAGDVLYVATTTNILLALDSSGSSSTHATKYSGGSDLCDIALSPDGLSVGPNSQLSRRRHHGLVFVSKGVPNRL